MWAVEDRRGEVYAVERSGLAALVRAREARDYLSEAASCGHPDAPAYERERLPIRCRYINARQAREIRAGATPVLEREP